MPTAPCVAGAPPFTSPLYPSLSQCAQQPAHCLPARAKLTSSVLSECSNPYQKWVLKRTIEWRKEYPGEECSEGSVHRGQVTPQSFNVRVKEGTTLTQLMLFKQDMCALPFPCEITREDPPSLVRLQGNALLPL